MKLRLSIFTVFCAVALGFPTAALASSNSVYYYVALGDSVAAIDNGYPQQLLVTLSEETPTLQLVNLACPGESTSSMISGYPATPPPIPGTLHFGPACQTIRTARNWTRRLPFSAPIGRSFAWSR